MICKDLNNSIKTPCNSYMIKRKDVNYQLYKFEVCISYQSFFKITLLWFILFNHGILIKNIKYHPLLFSERNNFYYQYQIRNWYFRILRLVKQ